MASPPSIASGTTTPVGDFSLGGVSFDALRIHHLEMHPVTLDTELG